MSASRCIGQAAIEGVIGIVGALILFVGAAAMWGWFVQSYVARQEAYQRTRVEAGSSDPGRDNFYDQSLLNIFNEPNLQGKTVRSDGGSHSD